MQSSQLRSLLRYVPETGEWFWRQTQNGRAVAGGRAGFLKDGRWFIQIYGSRYLASRLAWLYMTGKWPRKFVDHENRTPNDDRWLNLRLATRQQNNRNKGKYVNNTSGVTGVIPCGKKWRAYISTPRWTHLGMFATKEEAICARQRAAKEHFKEFAA